MQIIEIFDPELAMCVQGRGFPYRYVRRENGFEIIAFEMAEGFSEAFEELDLDEGCSIVRIYEASEAIPPNMAEESADVFRGRPVCGG